MKKRHLRALSILLLLSILFGIASCGGGSTHPSKQAEQTQAPAEGPRASDTGASSEAESPIGEKEEPEPSASSESSPITGNLSVHFIEG